MHKDFPAIRVAEFSDYDQDSVISIGGDLQCHLGVADLFTMHYYGFTPKQGFTPVSVDSSQYDRPDLRVEIWENHTPVSGNAGNIGACPLKLFVVRDSYTDAMKGFISTQFSRTVYAWQRTPPVDLIMREHPNIVLHEILERFLQNLLVLPDEIAKDSSFIKQNFPNYYKNNPYP